jgi:hypothetical protein
MFDVPLADHCWGERPAAGDSRHQSPRAAAASVGVGVPSLYTFLCTYFHGLPLFRGSKSENFFDFRARPYSLANKFLQKSEKIAFSFYSREGVRISGYN